MVWITSCWLQAIVLTLSPTSGGVPLTIVGANLDAAVSPMLTLFAADVQLINVVSGCTNDPILSVQTMIMHQDSAVVPRVL